MKTRTKLLMILLMMFYIIPTSEAATEKSRKRPKYLPFKKSIEQVSTRSPINIDVEATLIPCNILK